MGKTLTLLIAGALATACDKVPLTAPTGTTITVTVSRAAATIGDTVDVTATVIESAGTPVHNGTVVNFIGSFGTFDLSEARTQGGIASVRFTATASGTTKIVAFSGSARGESSDIKLGTAIVESLSLRVNSRQPANGVADLIAIVRDSAGAAVRNVPVSFSTTTGLLAEGQTLTDANGEARTTITVTRDATVTARAGTKEATGTVSFSLGPALSFTVAPAEPTTVTPVTVTVTGGTATAPQQDVQVHFGDGSTQNLGTLTGTAAASHAYARAGTYTIEVSASDGIQRITQRTTIIVREPSSIPVTLDVTPDPVCLGVTPCSGAATPPGTNGVATLTASGGGANVLRYEWSFGDGGTATTTGPSVTHRYTSEGFFTATVDVFAQNGQRGHAEDIVRVRP